MTSLKQHIYTFTLVFTWKNIYLLDDLSKQYETGRGAKSFQGNQYKSGEKPNTGSTPTENVNEKTAKKVNVSKNTVQRARAYVKAVKKNPEKYTGKKKLD